MRKPEFAVDTLKLLIQKFIYSSSTVVATFLILMQPIQAAEMCVQAPVIGAAQNPPLLHIEDMTYAGAFTFPENTYGQSSMNYAQGIIEQHGNSMFVVGYGGDGHIAEFLVPELVLSAEISELRSTGAPIQVFSSVLNRAAGGNSEGINRATGMEVIDGQLIVNAHDWYDGDTNNTDTTVIISDADNLANSTVDGFFDFPGAARAGGWISPIPNDWQDALEGDYITGFSSATSIISRHSVGPSAHAFYAEDLFKATLSEPLIPTRKLMEFSLAEPLHQDLENTSGQNDLWTILSGAWYGFIVPGTSTYATFGSLSGVDSGIGYKITQNNGNLCGGYCAPDANDRHAYYWLFDVNDFIKVKNGELSASAVRPYDYGKFPAPFQPEGGAYPVAGGTFDESSRILYLTLEAGANTNQNVHSRTPLIIAYHLPIVIK